MTAVKAWLLRISSITSLKRANNGQQPFRNAKFDEAERYYREAADLPERHGDAAGLGEALGNLGE
jgi:hypothetical protein